MIITLTEILYFLILIGVIGFIFTGLFPIKTRTIYNYLHPKIFDFQDFKFAIIITAPAIVLHELSHKFTAMAFGFDATFEIFPLGLMLGIFLKLIHSPFLIIAPGYVIPASGLVQHQIAYRLVAFAGPLTNLLLWLIATLILKYKTKIKRKTTILLYLSKKINIFLFLFNMIPFGPFDGAKVFFGPH